MAENPPAFPFEEKTGDGSHWHSHPGMTLRDWFAGQAVTGEAATQGDSIWRAEDLAERAYAVADALLVHRSRGDGSTEPDATEADAEWAIAALRRAIEAAENSNQAGENAVVRAARAL